MKAAGFHNRAALFILMIVLIMEKKFYVFYLLVLYHVAMMIITRLLRNMLEHGYVQVHPGVRIHLWKKEQLLLFHLQVI